MLHIDSIGHIQLNSPQFSSIRIIMHKNTYAHPFEPTYLLTATPYTKPHTHNGPAH